MFKLKKVALVLLAVQLCLGMTGVVKSQALGLPSSKTADYDKRIVIWDKPVGYSKKTRATFFNLNIESSPTNFLHLIIIAHKKRQRSKI